MELGLLVYRRRESQDLLEPFSRRMTAPREARLEAKCERLTVNLLLDLRLQK